MQLNSWNDQPKLAVLCSNAGVAMLVQGDEAESPLGGRPVQSETALLKGRTAALTEPQDLHAAHLMHVLEAHTTQLKRGDAGFTSTTQLMQADSALSGSLPAALLNNVADTKVPFSGAMHLEARQAASSSPDFTAREVDKQDSQLSRDLLTEAAQPILYPVMPLQSAMQGGQNQVQPKGQDSLPLKKLANQQPVAAEHRAQSAQQPFDSFAGVHSLSQQQVSDQEEGDSQASSPSRWAATHVIITPTPSCMSDFSMTELGLSCLHAAASVSSVEDS